MSDHDLKIGEKVKSLRLKKGLSIEDVVSQSELSASTVAGVEDHTISPPLGTIVSLACALKVTVGDLLGYEANAPFCIVRGEERKSVSRFSSSGKSGGYSYESLGHQKQNRRMEPFFVTLTPAQTFQAEPNQHAGEEILFVVTGQVEVSLSNHTDILNPGDSIYFDSNLPHVVSCHGEEAAMIFAVIYTDKEMLIF